MNIPILPYYTYKAVKCYKILSHRNLYSEYYSQAIVYIHPNMTMISILFFFDYTFICTF